MPDEDFADIGPKIVTSWLARAAVELPSPCTIIRLTATLAIGRRNGLTEQACRVLRLPSIRGQFSDTVDAAAREQMSYRAFLAELLLGQIDDRARRHSERRIRAAGSPRDKSPHAFDFAANPNVDPTAIHTGKSHLLIALGHRRRHARVPGRVHPGHEAGQRTGRSRRRQVADEDHRPLRPRRSALHRRTRNSTAAARNDYSRF